MKTTFIFIKSSVLVALFFIFAIQLNAQQNYKLADYVNPNFRYHSLDFTVNLNGNGSLMYSKTGNSTWLKNNVSNFGGNFNVAYYQIKNTAKYQGVQTARIYTNGSWNKNFNNHHSSSTDLYTTTYKENNFNAEFNYSSTNRFYNSRKQFLEIEPQIMLGIGNNRVTNEENPVSAYPFNNKNLSKSNNLTFGLSVMVGTGRIENVENARLALYILNDLQKSGDVKKNLSNEQVDQIARFITKLRNKRFFDSRIQNIAEITSVDSLLTAMGIREHSGASYYMILNDDWNYANGPVRQTGHRFAFGVTPRYSNNFSKSTHENILNSGNSSTSQSISAKTQFTTLDFGAYYYLEKPVSLTWQHSTIVSFGYEMQKQLNSYLTDPAQSSDYEATVYNPNLHLSFEKIYGYYPNSRTNLALDLALQGFYYMEKPKDNTDLKSNQLRLYASIFLSGNYYFSPQLRLNLNAGVSEDYRHFDNYTGTSMHVLSHNNNLRPSISLSLRYSIF